MNSILNHSIKLLDLIFANKQCLISKATVPLVPENNYHPSLAIDFKLTSAHKYQQSNFYFNTTSHKSSSIIKFNFREADLLGLYVYLANVDWSTLNQFSDANLACTEFLSNINYAFSKFLPVFKNHIRQLSHPSKDNFCIIT